MRSSCHSSSGGAGYSSSSSSSSSSSASHGRSSLIGSGFQTGHHHIGGGALSIGGCDMGTTRIAVGGIGGGIGEYTETRTTTIHDGSAGHRLAMGGGIGSTMMHEAADWNMDGNRVALVGGGLHHHRVHIETVPEVQHIERTTVVHSTGGGGLYRSTDCSGDEIDAFNVARHHNTAGTGNYEVSKTIVSSTTLPTHHITGQQVVFDNFGHGGGQLHGHQQQKSYHSSSSYQYSG